MARESKRSWAGGPLLCASLLATSVSCGLVVSFDYDLSPRFSVRGTVVGLEKRSLRLLLNGDHELEVRDGDFSFPRILPDGAQFVVGFVSVPSAHACTLTGATGRIAGADASIQVHCPSTDATLKDLRVSGGPLTPAFDAAT